VARVTGIGGKFAWITDPEGNRIELWEPPGRPTDVSAE
jgi:predicted enzyme related to lactoylglutathione lyase